MRGFLGRTHLQLAVEKSAVPALERLAANDSLLQYSLRRFERDEPPQYESSTESSAHEDDDYETLKFSSMPAGESARMNEPLGDDERDNVIFSILEFIANPGTLYGRYAKTEDTRISRHLAHPLPTVWQDHIGGQRRGLIVRHNIKQYWEEAGVWNPAWGFPGRNVETRDDPFEWKWKWHPAETKEGQLDKAAATESEAVLTYGRKLAQRLLDQRRHLQRGEYSRVIPQSPLAPDATASQAEGFLLSRPWVLFAVEVAEETERYKRVDSNSTRPRYHYSPRTQVIKWWKERGDWTSHSPSSWFWPHETTAPSWPKNLSPLSEIKDTLLAQPPAIEFTPSEVDELEMIEGPESQQPKGFWTVTDDCVHVYPGQWAKPPEIKLINGSLFGHTGPMDAGPFGGATKHDDGEDAELANEQSATGSARRSRAKAAPKQDPAPQQLRRSPRLAAIRKRAAEAQLADEAPAKRAKRAKRAKPVAKSGAKAKAKKHDKKEPQQKPATARRQKPEAQAAAAAAAAASQPKTKGRPKRTPAPTAEPATARPRPKPATTRKAAPPPARPGRTKRNVGTADTNDKEKAAVPAAAGRGRGRPRGKRAVQA